MIQIDRSKIVRVFYNKEDILQCLTCDGIINQTNQKDCPKFFSHENSTIEFSCLGKYSSDIHRTIVYESTNGKLFNNTTDKIVSTIFNCGSDINQCHVEDCNNCNLHIVIEHFKEGQ